MSEATKDTIYIDIDDEITGIIDKVRASDAKIVALVLPKRASVLQSIVNMKLLKRSTDEDKKHLVLITTEASLLPLAGATGLMVAKSLTSRPEVPSAPVIDNSEESVSEGAGLSVDEPDFTPAAVASKPIGDLAGLPPAIVDDDGVETLEMDEEDDVANEDEATLATKTFEPDSAKVIPPKNKKLSVPNFERFRLLLILGAATIVLLIVGLYYAFTVLPKATIVIKTNATNLNATINFSADTAAKKLDITQSIVPAVAVQQQKNYTEQAPTTGTRNQGIKATGIVTASIVCTSKPKPIGAGVGVSSNNLTFITQDTLTFGSPTFDSNGNIICSGSVPVKAQQGGSSYNLPAKSTFAIAGYPSATATNSDAFTGGTDDILKIVSQNDIDMLKAKIKTADSTIKQALQNQLLQKSLYALPITFVTGTPKITTSANAGDTADSVTVNEEVIYTMLGVSQVDLRKLVDSNVKPQIDTTKQIILEEGLRAATFTAQNVSGTSAQLTLQTVASAGPDLNIAKITKEIAGIKSGQVKNLLTSNSGVTDVSVKLSPFWVTSVPKKLNKITVIIEKPKITASTTNANNP